MKNAIKHITALAAFALIVTGCYKEQAAAVYDKVSIHLYPEAPVFNADGTTANGDENYIGAVTIIKGTSKSDVHWAFSYPNLDWVDVSNATYVSTYNEVSGKASHEVSEAGIQVNVKPNPSYKRKFDIIVKTDDGDSQTFTFTQLGEKADAFVKASVSQIDIPCLGGDMDDITYETNMDSYSYSIRYDGQQKDWLKIADKGLGKFALNASAWESETEDRTASLIIKVGTEETSVDTCSISIKQLKYDTYYYCYGSSAGLDRANSVAMTKKEKGVYFTKAFFFDAGSNVICLNKDTRSESYPVYYLANDGSIKESSSAVSTSDLKIAANGLYTLTTDFNTMKWTMDRSIKCTNCMPDSELSKYPVKAYPAANGTSKTWMTVSLHWNGGASMGTLKLGSGLVAGHQTGGYGTPEDKTVPYAARISAYDTQENGGDVPEVYDNGTPLAEKFGRLYSATEYINGVPSGCLNDRYQMNNPYGEPGDSYTDDAGLSIQLENIIIANLSTYDGNAEGDAEAENDHPSLKLQIQGICPFGWHIANMQDWRDLIYAASVASQGSNKPVPANQACYKAMAGGSITNFAATLYSKDWFVWTKTGNEKNRSNIADSFGWNMFVQGWRLFATGYDYGPGDPTPRFYTPIPLMGQYTNSKKAYWRVYVTSESANMTINDGCDIGNGCGTAIRCVKNYKTN